MSAIGWDLIAAGVFVVAWLGYEFLIKAIARKGSINSDMLVIRGAWMRRLLTRDNRIADSALLGHLINSASFFASTNTLVIAASLGLMFGGERTVDQVRDLAIVAAAPAWLISVKLGLVVITLARGLLDFVWSIRQLNYLIALVGAAPVTLVGQEINEKYAAAMGAALNPALSTLNRGVRSYYFALAAAAWLAGAIPLLIATIASVALLAYRQTISPAASAIRRARDLLEADTGPFVG